MTDKPLYVASPLLPNLELLNDLLVQVWNSKIVTNNGPLHQKLEERLRAELSVPTAMLFNNGTIALLAALKLFDLPAGSEVITTPMTFAATAHAISWNGLVPVFADVNPVSMTIDPASVALAITPRTSAILGVHVYGNICDLKALDELARAHGLKLIYDAAHAFGVTVNGESIGNFGDATMFSFHATKLFTTIEGGALTTPRKDDAQKIYMLRNFGIKNEEEVADIGLNGKMNEIQAAIGLLNLDVYRDEIARRAHLRAAYDELLGDIPGITLQVRQPGVTRSEQYYPIRIHPEIFGRTRDEIYDELKGHNIFSRKYFYPICTDFVPYRGCKVVAATSNPVIHELKNQVLCLPFHGDVTEGHVSLIAGVMRRVEFHKQHRLQTVQG